MATTSFQGGGYPGRPYGSFAGRAEAAVVVASTSTPSGVGRRGKKRELFVKLGEVENRESTADFLKSQLKLRHLPDSAFVDPGEGKKAAKALAAQKKREAKMREEAAASARMAEASAQEEKARKLKAYNDSVIALLMIAAKEIE